MLPFLFSACTDSFDDASSPVAPAEPSVNAPAKELLYDRTSGSFVYRRSDPYTLDNFRRACDALRTGESLLPLTRAEQEEFGGEELRATHYALRVYPRNETEQWLIDRMDDVSRSYLPFDYAAASADDASAAGADSDSAPSVELEQSPYTVTYDDYVTADGEPVEPMTVRMPVMYVVWPCDKPLPDELDYKIDYEVFLPRSAAQTRSTGLGAEAMRLLELEAVCRAEGVARTRGEFELIKQEFPKVRTGTVLTYDNKLYENVPMAHLCVQFSYGTNIYTVYTDADGYYTSGVELFNATTYSFILSHNFWKIVRGESVVPITISKGTVGSTILSGSVIPVEPRPKEIILSADYLDYHIHRAVDYFYHGAHEITKHYYDGAGITIHSMKEPHLDGQTIAEFYYNPNANIRAYLTIYNADTENHWYYTDAMYLSGILHEFGHFCQYSERNRQYSSYVASHKLVRESYASYVGWLLGTKYYTERGYYLPTGGTDITANENRSWTKNTTIENGGHYSPLFVDLVDDYNQNPNKTNIYNYDAIHGVPNLVITKVAKEATTWASCKNILRSFVGQYYTSEELEEYFEPYDYWFAKYN